MSTTLLKKSGSVFNGCYFMTIWESNALENFWGYSNVHLNAYMPQKISLGLLVWPTNLSDCSDLDHWSCHIEAGTTQLQLLISFLKLLKFRASFCPARKWAAHIFMLLINLSTTVGREGLIAWGFIRLHAIGPLPWKGDGSLNTKPSSFQYPTYTTVVVHTTSCLHKRSQEQLSCRSPSPGLLCRVYLHSLFIFW